MGMMKRVFEYMQDELARQNRDSSVEAVSKEWDSHGFEWTKKLMAEREAREAAAKKTPAVTGKCEGGNDTYDGSESCEEEKCQECCPHDEWDHDQCMYCEKERCPGEAIDAAMDSMEDR